MRKDLRSHYPYGIFAKRGKRLRHRHRRYSELSWQREIFQRHNSSSLSIAEVLLRVELVVISSLAALSFSAMIGMLLMLGAGFGIRSSSTLILDMSWTYNA